MSGIHSLIINVHILGNFTINTQTSSWLFTEDYNLKYLFLYKLDLLFPTLTVIKLIPIGLPAINNHPSYF